MDHKTMLKKRNGRINNHGNICGMWQIFKTVSSKHKIMDFFQAMLETIILLSNKNIFIINENLSVYYHFIKR